MALQQQIVPAILMFNPRLIVIEAFIREPRFFWKTVRPYIGDALRSLRITQEGKQWISNACFLWSIEVKLFR
jgi:hypothetical protein